MTTTDNIRKLREEQNLTQEAIAELLNTTRSNYAYLENRGDKLTIEQAKQIANVLNRPIEEVIGIPRSTSEEDLKRIRDLEKEVLELKKSNKSLTNTINTFNTVFSLLKGQFMSKEAELTSALTNDQNTKDVLTAIGNNILSSRLLNNLINQKEDDDEEYKDDEEDQN